MFPRNESTLDRGVRAVLGAGLVLMALGLCVTSRKRLAAGVGLLGGSLLTTAATGSCQLYRVAGISTYSGD